MLVGAAIMVAFTMVALVSFQMSLGLRQTQAHAAHNAAESALAVAIARLGDSEGTLGVAGNETVRVEGPDGEVGIVTFAHDTTEVVQGRAIPLAWSTHNFKPLELTVAKPGYNRTVPKDCVHLMATGITAGGRVSRTEAIVHVPPFDYALATSGPVRLFGSTVAGVADLTKVARDERGSPVLPVEDMSHGNLGSNMGQVLIRSRVKGDAQCGAAIDLQQSVVDGETRQNASPITLPHYNLSDFDPLDKTVFMDVGETWEGVVLSGNARRQGNLEVPGDLLLDNGLLFVEGNLQVRGGIRGRGAVVVRGNVFLGGLTRVEADDSAALLVDGGITLAGDGIFQGILYCTGPFKANHVTIVGCLIQNSPAASPVELNEVRFLHASSASGFTFFRPAAMRFSYVSTAQPASAYPQLEADALAGQVPTSGLDAGRAPTVDSALGTGVPEASLSTYVHRNRLLTVTKRGGRLVYTMLSRERDIHLLDYRKTSDGGPLSVPLTPLSLQDLDLALGDAVVQRRLYPDSPWKGYPTSGPRAGLLSIYEFEDPADLFRWLKPHQEWVKGKHDQQQKSLAEDPAFVPEDYNGYWFEDVDIEAWQQHMRAQIAAAAQDAHGLAHTQVVNFQVNPSRYLAFADRMRIIYQGEL